MRVGRTKQNNEFSVNPDQFFNVASPEAAYILGLLWADGYVLRRKTTWRGNFYSEYRISLTNQRDDFDVFLPTLKKVGTWRVSYRKLKKRKEQGTATVSNRPLVNFLIENDYTSKSTLSACKILSKIPDNLKHYWFRGLFDGDGCIYHNPDGLHIKISICSSYEQNWEYVEKLFRETLNESSFFIRRNIRKNGNRHSKVEVVKRSAILKFLNYIYNGYKIDGIGLTRKYEKYLRVVERDLHCKKRSTSSIQLIHDQLTV